MKTLLFSVGAVLSVFVVPWVALAATYQYVTTEGEIGEVVAATATDALIIPDDIADNSGVIHVVEETMLPENMEVPVDENGAAN